MIPFYNFSNTFEFPLSGDVTQGIAPVFGDIEGIPEVEVEVVTTVASYGKQLGKLTEAVLALADKVGLDGPEVDAVKEIAEGVKGAKIAARDKARERAAKMAERLESLEGIGE